MSFSLRNLASDVIVSVEHNQAGKISHNIIGPSREGGL